MPVHAQHPTDLARNLPLQIAERGCELLLTKDPDSPDHRSEITVRGDSMQLHFEAPSQVRAGLNMTMTALLSTVYYTVKAIVDPTILPNAGLARPLSESGRGEERLPTARLRRPTSSSCGAPTHARRTRFSSIIY